MQALATIAGKIEARVIDLHAEVVSRALDALDRRLDAAEEHARTKCSYGAVLGIYTAAKILHHHLNKHYHDAPSKSEALDLWERAQNQDRRIRTLRIGMYNNVCLECEACRSRRRKWPDHTTFVPMNELVHDVVSVNRMTA